MACRWFFMIWILGSCPCVCFLYAFFLLEAILVIVSFFPCVQKRFFPCVNVCPLYFVAKYDLALMLWFYYTHICSGSRQTP